MTESHLYVHVPFCARRCTYCDFAIAVRRDVPTGEFGTLLQREISLRFPDGGSPMATMYIGGGTPSRLGAEGLTGVVAMLQATWPLLPGGEVTIEANPEDVTPAAAACWRTAGVTRVSLGAQSFDDRVLQWMHRTHDARAIGAAASALRDVGFTNWSLDLIFAVPEALGRDWRRDLELALTLEPPHVSCYGLTVEPNTPLGRQHARGAVHEAGEGRFASEFLEAHTLLENAGFEHYEVSNYARDGLQSRHNLAYWRRVPYVGLGPSAHGFDGSTRRWNEREYAAWAHRLEAGDDPVSGVEQLTPGQMAIEETLLGLRTSYGVRIDPEERGLAAEWCGEGWATLEGNRLRLTADGWLRVDALTAALTNLRSH